MHNAHIVNKGQFGSINRLAVEKGTVGVLRLKNRHIGHL